MIKPLYYERKEVFGMKIVGVAACTAGIAHTYIAKEKLVKAAEKEDIRFI